MLAAAEKQRFSNASAGLSFILLDKLLMPAWGQLCRRDRKLTGGPERKGMGWGNDSVPALVKHLLRLLVSRAKPHLPALFLRRKVECMKCAAEQRL